jgi:two-component system, response regulator YesN
MSVEQRKNRPVRFLRILLLCILLTSLVSLFLSSLLYVNYERSLASQNAAFIQESLEKTANSVSFMSDWARTLAIQTLYDNDITTLLSYPSISQQNIIRLRNRIRSLRLSSPHLVSLYVFNGSTRQIFSDLGNLFAYTETNFYDQDIFPYLNQMTDKHHLVPIPRRLDFTLDGSVRVQSDVYTYILYENPKSRKHNDNIIVLNIARQWLDDAIKTLGTDMESPLLIVDQSATVAYGAGETQIGTSLSDDRLVMNVLGRRESTGYLIDGRGKGRIHVTWVRPDENREGWTFLYRVPVDVLTRDIVSLQRTTVRMSLIALFIGLLGSFAYALSVFRPIQRLQRRLGRLETDEGVRMERLRQSFLTSLYRPGSPQGEALREEAARLDINLPDGPLVPMMVIADRMSKRQQMPVRANQLLHEDIRAGLQAHFGPQALIAEMEPLLFAIVEPALTGDSCHDKRMGAFLDHFNQASASLEPMTSHAISLSAVLAPCVGSLGELPAAWIMMKQALVGRLFLGHGCLIDLSRVPDVPPSSNRELWQKEKLLSQKLLMRELDEALDIVSQMLGAVNGHYGNRFQLTMLRIVSVLMDTLDKLNADRKNPIRLELDALLVQMERFELLSEVLDAYRLVFRELDGQWGSDKTMDHMALMAQIKEEVGKRHADPTLTIDSFPELTDLSGIHLSRLYRRLTGVSFSDYLRQVRIHHACQLLQNTGVPIQDIASRTGFPSPNHFYALFKKEKGTTPGQYRKDQQLQAVSCGKPDGSDAHLPTD